MTVLLGTAAGCVILAVSALTFWHRSGSVWLETGTLLYLGGVILVTRVFNIPRNDALSRVDPAAAEGAALWTRFIETWTIWNHVRTLAALMAAACLTIASHAELGPIA